MLKKYAIAASAAAVVFSATAFAGISALADVNAVTPSTNDINRTNGWAHVDQLSMGVGTTDLQFISTRSFWSCFEYRTDGDTSQVIAEHGGVNYNTDITDGLYPYYCQNNNSSTHTITANAYVEVRMVFGAERDERFDWTRFDVLYPRTAEITAPISGETVYGSVSFEAYLDDDDADSIQWAVREGTCAAGVGTVFGNVDGHHDVATIDQSVLSNQTFSFTGDMSSMTPGMYCFIYNPVEDSGESNIRETVGFNVVQPPPTDINQCKKDGWKNLVDSNGNSFKNQGDCVSFVATGGKNTAGGI